MRINNNLMAMNTHRQLGMSNAAGAKSMEKLSSGMRINRAGDDAAGLAISEKMRGQIRGLNQASKNAQDGISFIQTAEGALQETQAILQRMRELAVQSANDTNVAVDRGEIQKEMDQLSSEITRIANNTEFNTQTLLNGGIQENGLGEVKFHIGANEGQDINLSIKAMDAKSLGVARDMKEGSLKAGATGVTAADVKDTTTLVGSAAGVDHTVTAADVAATNAKVNLATDYAIEAKAGGAYVGAAGEGIKVVLTTNAGAAASSFDAATGTLTISATTGTKAALEAALAAGNTDVTNNFQFSGVGSATATAGNYSLTGGADAKIKYSIGTTDVTVAKDATKVEFTDLGVTLTKDASADTAAKNTGIVVTVKSEAATAATAQGDGTMSKAVAKAGINVSSQKTASEAVTTINKAIESVSAERSKLGAMQNRLEHTIKNLDTSAENLQASEGRIRDVDMAKEMMEQTKQNILQQAATAMLAQANQAPQGVLQLLR